MSNFGLYPGDLVDSMIRTVDDRPVPIGHTIVAIISGDVDKGVYDWENHGTAVCIDAEGHYFATAAHVIDDIREKHPENGLCILKFLQDIKKVLAVPIYKVIPHELTDLAICCAGEVVVGVEGDKLTNPRFILNTRIAARGEKVTALGYGGIAYNGKYNLYYSEGHVRKYYEHGVDIVMNPYPCYELELSSMGRMSGCPILNERCEMIAILSIGVHGTDIAYAIPISYIMDFLLRSGAVVYREDVLDGKIPTMSVPVIYEG